MYKFESKLFPGYINYLFWEDQNFNKVICEGAHMQNSLGKVNWVNVLEDRYNLNKNTTNIRVTVLGPLTHTKIVKS